MNQNKVDKLIIKLFENSISEQESEFLIEWLQTAKNVEYFNAFVEINHLINFKSKFDYKPSLAKILQQHKKSKTRRIAPLLKYAAAILLLISSGYFIYNQNSEKESIKTEAPIIVNNIETGTDKATLTLEDGTNVVLQKGQSYQTTNLSSNGEELIYNVESGSKTETAYNYLTIPRGGEFNVKLPDGTQVWLNSETKLKYPIVFEKNKTRQVELIYGEAYFDVSPSIYHNGADFKVVHEMQEIKVLGTEFNIKAYSNETNIYTTLVEGNVEVSNANFKQNLKPNQQANLNLLTNKVAITEVDVYNEIAWKDGVFSFENTPLNEIMIVLSRWYDIDFVFEKPNLANEKFIGSLYKSYSIENILDAMKNTKVINSFEIKNKSILIK